MTDPAFSLEDTRVTRRYFDKFDTITQHLARVAGVVEAEKRLAKHEVRTLATYLARLRYTFRALAHKYHFAGRLPHAGQLTFDRAGSGFPVFHELVTMANDAAQAGRHLAGQPGVEALKERMVEAIISDRRIPTDLQYALSQRLYYEEMSKGNLFWAQNDPECHWQGLAETGDRTFYLHWAVYDSQLNLPQIYLMELRDSGRTALPKDARRWPSVQAHLMAQSLGGLTLLTIARGFDEDFDDLHPLSLKRIHLGPMYSHAFTRQAGPLREVLREADAPRGEDWALTWTVEQLAAERSERIPGNWFKKVERQIYAVDPMATAGGEVGASAIERAVILPQRPYQVLAERRPPGFNHVRKFVVSRTGQVMSVA